MDAPDKELIKDARLAAGLTQEAAGAKIGSYGRRWRAWENGEFKMPPYALELFLIKTDLYDEFKDRLL